MWIFVIHRNMDTNVIVLLWCVFLLQAQKLKSNSSADGILCVVSFCSAVHLTAFCAFQYKQMEKIN